MSRILQIFGGPNGSGKSSLIKQMSPVGPVVNADEIQKILGCSALEAAQNAEKTREMLLASRVSFTFESVLSTERNFTLMKRAKNTGYYVRCIYILTNDPKINVSRVAMRVSAGGHDVPTNKIVSRYWRAMKKIPELINICDECYIFDNSFERGFGEPAIIVSWARGTLELFPNSAWSQEKLELLVDGKYTEA